MTTYDLTLFGRYIKLKNCSICDQYTDKQICSKCEYMIEDLNN